MAALDFPSSPTVGQTYTANGLTYTWDGTSWDTNNTVSLSNVSGTLAIANGGTNQTTYTSPVSSIAGLIWFDGTSFQNDSSTSHVGYNASTNTFYANNVNFSGTMTATIDGGTF